MCTGRANLDGFRLEYARVRCVAYRTSLRTLRRPVFVGHAASPGGGNSADLRCLNLYFCDARTDREMHQHQLLQARRCPWKKSIEFLEA
jgi:hypothetical protein